MMKRWKKLSKRSALLLLLLKKDEIKKEKIRSVMEKGVHVKGEQSIES